jgi:hypothetical protein
MENAIRYQRYGRNRWRMQLGIKDMEEIDG